MKHFHIFLLTLLTAALTACGGQHQDGNAPEGDSLQSPFPLPGDLTVYGLACDGCNDSVVVLMPQDCSDPITFNILQATKRHRVIGLPKVGDLIGVLPSAEDSLVADMVIDIEDLRGSWCFLQLPQWRNPDDLAAIRAVPDSLRQELFTPREYTLSLHHQWVASMTGTALRSTEKDEESPVVYPPVNRYSKWSVWNGKLLLTKSVMKIDSENNMTLEDADVDTAEIVMLLPDSLVLQRHNKVQGFYRKKD